MRQLSAIFTALLLSSILSVSLLAKNITLSQERLQSFKKTYKPLQDRSITLLEGIDEGETYFLKLQYKKRTYAKIMYAFIDKKSQQLYVGTRYSKEGSLSEFPKTDTAIQQIKDGVFFSFGTGKKELYLVTDPDCPYCKKFEKASEGKLKEYRIHVIFHPFDFHKKAPLMVAWIMQGKDEAEKKKRMNELMVKGSKTYTTVKTLSKSIKEQIKKGHKATQALGAIGSPLVYDAKFNNISTKELLK